MSAPRSVLVARVDEFGLFSSLPENCEAHLSDNEQKYLSHNFSVCQLRELNSLEILACHSRDFGTCGVFAR